MTMESAVDGVNFEIEPGNVRINRRNGSGKTTIGRSIIGLENNIRSDLFNGKDVFD